MNSHLSFSLSSSLFKILSIHTSKNIQPVVYRIEYYPNLIIFPPFFLLYIYYSQRIIFDKPTKERLPKGWCYMFYCPLPGCKYHISQHGRTQQGSLKAFQSYTLLKQHFLKIHASKNKVCDQCNAGNQCSNLKKKGFKKKYFLFSFVYIKKAKINGFSEFFFNGARGKKTENKLQSKVNFSLLLR